VKGQISILMQYIFFITKRPDNGAQLEPKHVVVNELEFGVVCYWFVVYTCENISCFFSVVVGISDYRAVNGREISE